MHSKAHFCTQVWKPVAARQPFFPCILVIFTFCVLQVLQCRLVLFNCSPETTTYPTQFTNNHSLLLFSKVQVLWFCSCIWLCRFLVYLFPCYKHDSFQNIFSHQCIRFPQEVGLGRRCRRLLVVVCHSQDLGTQCSKMDYQGHRECFLTRLLIVQITICITRSFKTFELGLWFPLPFAKDSFTT